jgi:hypothetical protein
VLAKDDVILEDDWGIWWLWSSYQDYKLEVSLDLPMKKTFVVALRGKRQFM